MSELPDDITDPPMYYTPKGEPCGMRTWVMYRESEWKLIARTRIGLPGGGHARVSTVYLGIDHSFGFGPPLIFETMVFWDDTDPGSEDYCERYPTREAASAGHDRAIAWLKEKMGLPANVPLED